ncbi:hypothetical protein [Tumebacillus flagellatus]|uniref:Uncharacterized protein n=1 Tax=Tumebacillus flagellatus TaxID=1157490 RepID=A0A074M7Y4_9BACL|nr:hypothetical protein [Tumebacillus flagellatus]KEO82077.1 hypothetical protein EL26_17360 [Tumebacillus flagellatus]
MITNRELTERLQEWIPQELFHQIETTTATIQEKESDGYAEIACTLPTDEAFELQLEGKSFPTLRRQNCADGILLLRRPDGEWELHIIECKRTVDKNKWARVKKQFLGAIQRATAILAPVGIHVTKFKLYTAYRDDELENEIMSRMALAKTLPAGQTRPPYFDWLDGQLTLWVKNDLSHEKIKLNSDGEAQYLLQCL